MDAPAYVLATLTKAEKGGAHPAELAALRRRLEQLDSPHAGLLPGSDLEPLTDVAGLEELPEPSPEVAREVLDRLVVVKLNGGLGTSMGLTGPKSLLRVKGGLSFLDVIAQQVLAVRERYGVRLPLLLMNSVITREPSLAVLERYDDLDVQDFLQGREPKLRANDRFPVEWPADPELEWCPPGHGDLYTALTASGTLDRLLDAGMRWCFVSNSDNLGAIVDARVAAWVAAEQIPFAMEVVRGTAADRKGGHLARYGDRIVLRETAQVPEGDDSFSDVERWRYYNTNNLWIDLEALKRLQQEDPAAPELPLIVNRKTVDPKDASSTPVIQLETAMGAAIGSIAGARPVLVPRTRFAPVKTTNDLLVVRSDAYEMADDGQVLPAYEGAGPVVTLDPEHYRLMPDFEQRFPAGPPSLRQARRLQVDGDVTFGADVTIEGDVHLTGPSQIPDGETLTS
ncbi:UTP--glucose-1-phosphate uridylyltransferase [Actinoplanes sp. Pm04-4]|uniref:UTP--glucose-1-phosphate uridylyltransferase n=1 Tax=Paractinoplanes pyxinae TaxID=2997416 RepID=A0ABT4AR27_9ACTN|nr:UTP--glucose-1-phosphate uridylyltransferase [Actinoplanes pyxinae]MCY1136699.1 UTP--glucose-1-phosphate uridylyltransferase [Actinoplanes pyxinae]